MSEPRYFSWPNAQLLPGYAADLGRGRAGGLQVGPMFRAAGATEEEMPGEECFPRQSQETSRKSPLGLAHLSSEKPNVPIQAQWAFSRRPRALPSGTAEAEAGVSDWCRSGDGFALFNENTHKRLRSEG